MSEILINALRIQKDIEAIEEAANNLPLKQSRIDYGGTSVAMERFNEMYERFSKALIEYQEILYLDLKKTSSAVKAMQTTDEILSDRMKD